MKTALIKLTKSEKAEIDKAEEISDFAGSVVKHGIITRKLNKVKKKVKKSKILDAEFVSDVKLLSRRGVERPFFDSMFALLVAAAAVAHENDQKKRK
jgi:hypothetical protein